MLATTAGCEFDVERGPDSLWIRIRGIEPGSAHPSEIAEELLELADKHFIYRIVLDLHHVAKLEEDLIGHLEKVQQHVQGHDGFLRLCGLSAGNRKALQRFGLDDLCLAYDTREEAMFGGSDPRLPR